MTTNNKASSSEPKPDRPKGFVGVGLATGIGALLLLVGVGVGFTTSHAFGGNDRSDGIDRRGDISNRMGDGNFPSNGEMPRGMPGGLMGGTLGKVTSISDASITLTDNRSGGSVTFNLDTNTDVTNNNDAAKISDIKVGDTVSVRGTSADDDMLADSIDINPSTR